MTTVVQGDVRNIAEALGVPERGRRVVDQMAAVIEDVRRHSLAARGDGAPPRIALVEWIEPIMGCGHWCARAIFLLLAVQQNHNT